MKYFSLSFSLQKEDYNAYYKDFSKGHLINGLKQSFFIISFSVFFTAYAFLQQDYNFVFAIVLFCLSLIFMPVYFAKKISTSFYVSKHGRKEARYDFFADHIEIHIGADENCRQISEKHLKMNGFTQVVESKRNFYFAYMNEKTLIIPKRVLNEETYGMIKNLIDNYFSSVYLSI